MLPAIRWHARFPVPVFRTTAGFTPAPGAETWVPVALGSSNKNFKLKNATLDSMSFPAVDVMHTFTAKWWKEPSPGVYVFDFEQNLSGWILLKMIFCAAGQKITFRHAELLQHPPYGPIDGNSKPRPPPSRPASFSFSLLSSPLSAHTGDDSLPVRMAGSWGNAREPRRRGQTLVLIYLSIYSGPTANF